MRLLARLDDLLMRSGARTRQQSDDRECGGERRCEAAARVELRQDLRLRAISEMPINPKEIASPAR
jgi:hypothetical protein